MRPDTIPQLGKCQHPRHIPKRDHIEAGKQIPYLTMFSDGLPDLLRHRAPEPRIQGDLLCMQMPQQLTVKREAPDVPSIRIPCELLQNVPDKVMISPDQIEDMCHTPGCPMGGAEFNCFVVEPRIGGGADARAPAPSACRNRHHASLCLLVLAVEA